MRRKEIIECKFTIGAPEVILNGSEIISLEVSIR